jgi:hypothetical protein
MISNDLFRLNTPDIVMFYGDYPVYKLNFCFSSPCKMDERAGYMRIKV